MRLNIFGEKVKENRLKKGLTQEELAKKLFVSKKTVSKWETGRGLPDPALLPHIAKVLGTSIDELFDGKQRDYYTDFHEKVDEYALYEQSYRKQQGWLTFWKIVAVVMSVIIVILSITANNFRKKYESALTETKYTLCWRDYSKTANEDDWQTQTFTVEELRKNSSFTIQTDPYACVVVVLQKKTYNADGRMIRHETIPIADHEMYIDGKEGQVFDVYPNDYYENKRVTYESKFGVPERLCSVVCRTPWVHRIEYRNHLLYVNVGIPTPDDRKSLSMRYTTTTGESISVSGTVVDPYIVAKKVCYFISNSSNVPEVLEEKAIGKGPYTRGKLEFLQWTETNGEQVVYTIDFATYGQEEMMAFSEWSSGGRISIIHQCPYTKAWRNGLSSWENCVYPVRIEVIGSSKYRDRVLDFDLYVK